MRSTTRYRGLRHDVEAAEEEGYFARRRLGSVRAVCRVFFNVEAEFLANRPWPRLGRVRRTHQFAPLRDRTAGLQSHHHHRPRGHILAERGEEWPRLVHLVKCLGLHARKPHETHRANLKASALDALNDVARKPARYRVGLDDRQCPFDLHPVRAVLIRARVERRRQFLPPSSAVFIVAPKSAGLIATLMPAAFSAAILSAAPPCPPEMIAPAWPIRRPVGAVCPAMNATTGFLKFCFIYVAASSSAVPPISPIKITASVPESLLNSSNTSIWPVPIIGSPPIPTQVDCPILSWVS